MAFYYVKANGTCSQDSEDGRETVARTGSWTATSGDYYDSLTDAVTGTKTNPTFGDYIIWSDASSDAITGSTVVSIPDGVTVVVVDDSNQETYSPATTALINNTANNGYRPGFVTDATAVSGFCGAYIKDGEAHAPLADASAVDYRDCIIESVKATRSISFQRKHSGNIAINCTLDASAATSGRFFVGGNWSFLGGEITSGATSVTVIEGASGMGCPRFIGVDFSNSPSDIPLYNCGTSSIDTQNPVLFLGCKLPSGWTIANLTHCPQNKITVMESDSRYQYFEEQTYGTLDFVIDKFYDAHDTLDDGLTQGSLEIETNSATSSVNVCRYGGFSYLTWFSRVNTEAASKKKVRIRFVCVSGDSLDSGDVTFIVTYPDSANAYQKHCVEHWLPEFQPGSALSTETTNGNWTGTGLATNAYYLDIDMGSPGNGVVSVTPGVTKPDVTVYFSWQLEFVA